MSAPLRVDTSDFERQTRVDKTREHAALYDRHGRLLLTRTGGVDSVAFSEDELQRAISGLLLHSHPLGKPPSGADLALAARYGLTLRITGSTPDGERFYYRVRMPSANVHRAEFLETAFDDAVEQARERVPHGLNIWAAEREARHLAVTWLAEEYGFEYARSRPDQPISETSRAELARLDVMGRVDQVLKEQVFEPLHAQLVKALVRHSAPDGLIPINRLGAVREAAHIQVQRAILGKATQVGNATPYTEQNGTVIPRSPYFRVVWNAMQQAADAAIEHHAAIMRKYLPEDLRAVLLQATLDPFHPGLHEMDDDTDWAPPAMQYDPLHQWLGEDGKQLSDRIWNVTGEMRRKLDLYLGQAITSGKPVAQMARELEDFLLPGRKLVRTSALYGTDLSFDALRLARTEVAAAYHRADSAAAQLDPFVESYQPFTAPSHACCDNCDTIAAGGPYPKSDLTHLPPYHSHCICGVFWKVVEHVADVVDWLRTLLSKAKTTFLNFIGPLSKRFARLLFRGGERA